MAYGYQGYGQNQGNNPRYSRLLSLMGNNVRNYARYRQLQNTPRYDSATGSPQGNPAYRYDHAWSGFADPSGGYPAPPTDPFIPGAPQGGLPDWANAGSGSNPGFIWGGGTTPADGSFNLPPLGTTNPPPGSSSSPPPSPPSSGGGGGGGFLPSNATSGLIGYGGMTDWASMGADTATQYDAYGQPLPEGTDPYQYGKDPVSGYNTYTTYQTQTDPETGETIQVPVTYYYNWITKTWTRM